MLGIVGIIAFLTVLGLSLFITRQEGMMVLGIYRSDGDYIGVPRGETEIYDKDTLVVYGRSKSLRELE